MPMGKLRTPEQLQLFFNKQKELNLKKRERQKQKQKKAYKKASEEVKKTLADKTVHNNKITAHKQKEGTKRLQCITIYHSNLIERETAYTDLYSKEELINIETLFPGEMGRINWDKFYELVEITKNWIKQYTL